MRRGAQNGASSDGGPHPLMHASHLLPHLQSKGADAAQAGAQVGARTSPKSERGCMPARWHAALSVTLHMAPGSEYCASSMWATRLRWDAARWSSRASPSIALCRNDRFEGFEAESGR